jgi:hypothetical protein
MSPPARSGKVCPTARDRALAGRDAPATGAKKHPVGGKPRGQGRPETAGKGMGGVLRSHSTEEGGELSKGGTHWRKGVNERT